MFHTHAHPLEYVWLVTAVAGLLYVARSLMSARSDLIYTKTHLHSKRSLFTSRVVYLSSAISFSVHALLFCMSAWAILNEPPPPRFPEVPQLYGTVIGSTVMSTVLTMQSALHWHWRQRMREPVQSHG